MCNILKNGVFSPTTDIFQQENIIITFFRVYYNVILLYVVPAVYYIYDVQYIII